MSRRISKGFDSIRTTWGGLGTALRSTMKEGYGQSDLRSDLGAGVTVGIVALPLSMALAIASGLPPQHGLYTAIVAGLVIAVLGGSRVQVSGPTAAFVAVLVPITAKYGLAGLAIATLMAGGIQLVMGLTGMGRLIQFIPYPVVTGFTAGIAVVIATLQIKDFLGLTVAGGHEHYLDRVAALVKALPTLRPADLIVGTFTLLVLAFWNRFFKRIPSPFFALAGAALLAMGIEAFLPGTDVATIQDRFAQPGSPYGIPRALPLPGLPWEFHAPGDAEFAWSTGLIKELSLAAFAIAMLGAIESLLSAVVADGMSGKTHDPNSELVGQGIGNIVAPFFGGFAATGAIARTATNIRFGARSPVASMTHAVFILAAMLAIAPWLGLLPMAALAALLLRVAWHMSEARHFVRTMRVAPASDVAVLLICFFLTVVFDMVIAVSAGVMLASLLFIRRMSDVTNVRLVGHSTDRPEIEGVLIYEIAGPLFFGAAQKAMSALKTIQNNARVVVLDMRNAPVMDMTGLMNLESALERLEILGVPVIVAGVNKELRRLMAREIRQKKNLRIRMSFERALDEARALASEASRGDAGRGHTAGAKAGHIRPSQVNQKPLAPGA